MPPKKLYKYRPFHVNTLRAITEAEVFFAPPSTFNDPLDCDPTLDVDISRVYLERLAYRMFLRRMDKEKAAQEINRMRYYSTEIGDYKSDLEAESYLNAMLAREIKNELDSELGDEGVLSLSATWASGLMWSHYADEHRGICIEYDTRDQPHNRLMKVNYTAPRAIKTSDLWQWKAKDDSEAREQVIQTYFYTKSHEWRYEREWRDVRDQSGVTGVPFRITAILFGLRADPSIITSIVRLLHDHQKIKLWQVVPKDSTFGLRRRQVDRDEINALGVREPSFLMFKDLVWDDDMERLDELDPVEIINQH